MRRFLRNLAVIASVMMVGAPAWADLNVVATVPALGALIEDIGGAHVEVTTLASASEDPHYVEARPNFVLALSRADLVVAVGMDLEVGWLPVLRQQARNPAIVGGNGYFEAGTAVAALGVPATLDRAQGDVHPGGNPHFVYDPRAMAQVATALGERMAALDPSQAAAYRSGAQATSSALLAFAERERARFASMPATARRVASYHESFPYLIDWLGLTQVATIEPRPGVPPTPSHTAEVIGAMRSQGARVVLQESYYPAATSETVASMAGGSVVSITSGPNVAVGESYLAWVTRTTEAIHAALQ